MFKKAAVFTDIHFGLKGNSKVHNDDCEDFIDWYIQTAKENGCETGIFCGDWHHNRNSLNLTTSLPAKYPHDLSNASIWLQIKPHS